MKKLTKQQKIFADEYLIDLNGTRAYMVAYPRVKKKSTAAVNAYNHLRKPNISAYIEAAMDARAKRTEITQDMVLKEYARIAFFDPRKFFESDGSLKKITDLDDDSAACIAGMDIITKNVIGSDGNFEPEYTKKIKIADKLKALQDLGRHLVLFDKKDHENDDENKTEMLKRIAEMLPV